MATLNISILLTATCSSNCTKGTNCCISMTTYLRYLHPAEGFTCLANNTQKTPLLCKAAMVTRMSHYLMLYVYTLSCYKPLTLLEPCNSSFSRTYFVKTTNITGRPPSLLLGQWYQSTASRRHAIDKITTGSHYRKHKSKSNKR